MGVSPRGKPRGLEQGEGPSGGALQNPVGKPSADTAGSVRGPAGPARKASNWIRTELSPQPRGLELSPSLSEQEREMHIQMCLMFYVVHTHML